LPDSFTPPQTPSLGIRVVRRGPKHPYFKADFRVFIGDKEIGIQSLSPLRLGDPDPVDGEILQTVTLRRAVSRDQTLFAWREAIAAGKDDARDVTIVQLASPEGVVLNIWRLRTAVPLRWDGPDFNAQSDEIAVEEIEVAYTGIEWRTSV
jgi:hypothetical protein